MIRLTLLKEAARFTLLNELNLLTLPYCPNDDRGMVNEGVRLNVWRRVAAVSAEAAGMHATEAAGMHAAEAAGMHATKPPKPPP